MTTTGAPGASAASLGLADPAIYQGRFADAATIAQSGIAADEQRRTRAGAIANYSALAMRTQATARRSEPKTQH